MIGIVTILVHGDVGRGNHGAGVSNEALWAITLKITLGVG